MNIEDEIAKLEKIVEVLGEPKTTLNDGIANYEKGVKIAKSVLENLSQSKGKIVELTEELNKLVEKNFDVND